MDVVRAGRSGRMRKSMSRRRDRRKFSKTAGATRKENLAYRVMRGGIRL